MTRETKTITVVQCVKLDMELPALDRPPFPGPLGKRVFENVSKLAYSQWQTQATLLINHYGLNIADPLAQACLVEQREAFLFGEGPGANVTSAPVAGGKGGPARK